VSILQQFTDGYSRAARLLPALLVSLPLTVLAVTSIPDAVSWWGKIFALLVASGLPFVLVQTVRDRGKRMEPMLFETWGGVPTTVMLRWSHQPTKTAVARRHSLVEKVLGIQLPNETEEESDPAEADEAYGVAVTALRERTRDSQRFPLVHQELTAYGFRRNTYACRVVGLIVCGLSLVFIIVLPWAGAVSMDWKQQVALSAFDALWAGIWLGIFTRDWVRRAAETYAHQLMASLEILNFDSKPPDAT
jgi:hypothetical protein